MKIGKLGFRVRGFGRPFIRSCVWQNGGQLGIRALGSITYRPGEETLSRWDWCILFCFILGFILNPWFGCIDTHASCRCIIHDIDVWVVASIWVFVYSLYALLLHWVYTLGRHYTLSDFSRHRFLTVRCLRIFSIYPTLIDLRTWFRYHWRSIFIDSYRCITGRC